MNVILVTGEKVSKQFIFFVCPKPLAKGRALRFSIESPSFSFLFELHLQPIDLQLGGKST